MTMQRKNLPELFTTCHRERSRRGTFLQQAQDKSFARSDNKAIIAIVEALSSRAKPRDNWIPVILISTLRRNLNPLQHRDELTVKAS